LEFLIWLKSTSLAEWVLYSPWANPILLCMHASGMALVVGCGLMTSLRVLGYGRSVPLSLFERLIPFAWAGVALNAVSGMLLFISDGDRYIGNWTFQLKIGFILSAGIATWLLWRILLNEGRAQTGAPLVGDDWDDGMRAVGAQGIGIDAGGQVETFSPKARVAATITALFWISAIIAGRMIAYTLAPGFE
jgi:hypothetical protein